jgi:hypothetical protein
MQDACDRPATLAEIVTQPDATAAKTRWGARALGRSKAGTSPPLSAESRSTFPPTLVRFRMARRLLIGEA